MSTACILVAAGSGERLGAGRPKALVEVSGRPMLAHAVEGVVRSGAVDLLVVVAPPAYEAGLGALIAEAGLPGTVVTGGATRQQSVQAGLAALPDDVDVVLVHDAARCLTPPGQTAAVAAAVRAGAGAVVPAVPVVDTLVEVDETGATVTGSPDRSRLRAVQTPQGFRRDLLERAHASAREGGDTDATDDAGLVRRVGLEVRVIPGDQTAFKITAPHDLTRAEAVLRTATRPAQ